MGLWGQEGRGEEEQMLDRNTLPLQSLRAPPEKDGGRTKNKSM